MQRMPPGSTRLGGKRLAGPAAGAYTPAMAPIACLLLAVPR
jgi:hypothetical protein